MLWDLSRWLGGKESACQCKRHKRRGFNPWAGKIPWRRAWQPTPVFLSGEFHGQRSLQATVHGVTMSRTQLNMFCGRQFFPWSLIKASVIGNMLQFHIQIKLQNALYRTTLACVAKLWKCCTDLGVEICVAK